MSRGAPRSAASLYKTEAEIAEIMGVCEKTWRANAKILEKRGLPPRDPMFANRRYMPAVRAYFDRLHNIDADSASLQPDGEENWHDYRNNGRARTKAEAA